MFKKNVFALLQCLRRMYLRYCNVYEECICAITMFKKNVFANVYCNVYEECICAITMFTKNVFALLQCLRRMYLRYCNV